jgi:hypothetical protein
MPDAARMSGNRRKQLIFAFLMAKFEGYCAYCGRRVIRSPGTPSAPDRATIDHVVPRCRGGTSRLDNMVLACRTCNEVKGRGIWRVEWPGLDDDMIREEKAALLTAMRPAWLHDEFC